METLNKIKKEIQTELTKWDNGEIAWTVSNQFDESTLESALENANELSVFKMRKFYGDFKAPLMECAGFLSSFEVPELNTAWID